MTVTTNTATTISMSCWVIARSFSSCSRWNHHGWNNHYCVSVFWWRCGWWSSTIFIFITITSSPPCTRRFIVISSTSGCIIIVIVLTIVAWLRQRLVLLSIRVVRVLHLLPLRLSWLLLWYCICCQRWIRYMHSFSHYSTIFVLTVEIRLLMLAYLLLLLHLWYISLSVLPPFVLFLYFSTRHLTLISQSVLLMLLSLMMT